MRTIISSFLVAIVAVLSQGCSIVIRPEPDKLAIQDMRVNFDDPVLNKRKIFLFGEIDRRAAEITIQKLLYLDNDGHAPIDLYLQTPGGEIKHAWAIQQTMRLISSPVNTYALSECNSGGALLLAAGTGKRRAFHGAVIMVHGLKVHGRPPSEAVGLIQEAYTDFWRKRSRVPESWLPLPFDIKHILSAEQALDYGIVDEIVDK